MRRGRLQGKGWAPKHRLLPKGPKTVGFDASRPVLFGCSSTVYIVAEVTKNRPSAIPGMLQRRLPSAPTTPLPGGGKGDSHEQVAQHNLDKATTMCRHAGYLSPLLGNVAPFVLEIDGGTAILEFVEGQSLLPLPYSQR